MGFILTNDRIIFVSFLVFGKFNIKMFVCMQGHSHKLSILDKGQAGCLGMNYKYIKLNRDNGQSMNKKFIKIEDEINI
jgi:hypothetical protein